MRSTLSALAALAVALLALATAHAAPSPSPSGQGAPAAAPTDGGVPPDVTVGLTMIYLNDKPVAVSPIVRKAERPLCPVRLARLLEFQVEYAPDAKVATLVKPSGETAMFKVGVDSVTVKTRGGVQRVVKMPLAPLILTPRLRSATDRMWIPLETVVDLAGGRMRWEGRKIRIERPKSGRKPH